MNKYLIKLLISLIMYALCTSVYADGVFYNSIPGQISAWDQSNWNKYIGPYNIQSNFYIDNYGQNILRVSGYTLCHGVFMLQKVVNNSRKDLIFGSKDDAIAFEKLLSYAIPNLYGLSQGNVPFEVYDSYHMVVAVGYIEQENTTGAILDRIKLHYLTNEWKDNSKNYACKYGPGI